MALDLSDLCFTFISQNWFNFLNKYIKPAAQIYTVLLVSKFFFSCASVSDLQQPPSYY